MEKVGDVIPMTMVKDPGRTPMRPTPASEADPPLRYLGLPEGVTTKAVVGESGGQRVVLASDGRYYQELVPTRVRPHIPERFRGERVSLDLYRPQTGSQRTALQMARRWVEAVVEGKGPMLALIGEQGTGKSHLAYSAVKVLYDRGVFCWCRPWYLLADQLRYGERGRRDREPMEVRDEMWSAKAVVIDEVRRTAGTEFDDTELAKFACHAYDNLIPVLMTTNWNPLEEVMGGPAASRFTQVVVEGPDAREG